MTKNCSWTDATLVNHDYCLMKSLQETSNDNMTVKAMLTKCATVTDFHSVASFKSLQVCFSREITETKQTAAWNEGSLKYVFNFLKLDGPNMQKQLSGSTACGIMRFNSVFWKLYQYQNVSFRFLFGGENEWILINFRPLIQSELSGSLLLDPCRSDLGQNGRQTRICVLQAFTPKVQVWHRVERGHYFPMERAAARTRLSLPRLAAKVELEQHTSSYWCEAEGMMEIISL